MHGESTNYLSITQANAISAILNNGTSIFMWAGSQTALNPHWQIWFDIDGPKKGLGRIGGDVFRVTLWYKDNPECKKGVWFMGLGLIEILLLIISLMDVQKILPGHMPDLVVLR